MANELLSHIKTEWSDIPTWVKIGTLVGGAGLFLLTKIGGGGAASATGTAPSAANVANPTGIVSLIPSYSSDGGSSIGTSGSGTPTNIGTNPNNIGLPSAAYNPIPVTPINQNPNNIGLPTAALNPVPIAAPLTPAQQSLQNSAIQSALGVYGGTPLNTTNPYTGMGSTWADVTQTQYAGGGQVTNLGVAQPTPQVGQVIPPAVQDSVVYQPGTSIPDWNATVQQAYQYPQNFSPGMTQPASVQNPIIPAIVPQSTPTSSPNYNLLSQQSAAQSAAYQASVAGGGYTPGGQAAFNAAHPLSSY